LLTAAALVACGGGSDDDAPAPQDPPPVTVQGDPDAAAPPPVAPPPDTKPTPKTSIAVKGNALVDADGEPVRLLGVNYSGGEYMCIQGRGIFDGPPEGVSLADAIVSWKANVVRVSVNEHCWLGLPGVDPRYSGKPYRDAIGALVTELRAKDLYVIVEVHWSSSIAGQAVEQQPMLDRDNGLPFWHSVADTFKDDPGILFDVYNEPFLDVTNTNHAYDDDPWACWRLGCEVHFKSETYVSAGVQPVIAEIRAAGATNVVLLGGLDYANDTRGMPGHWPTDPASQAAASVHVYADKRCNDESCWSAEIDGISSFVPVVAGELGQTDCGRDFVDGFMAWADPRGMGYLGWTFNVADCSSRPSLISDWSGTPTPFGAAFKERFAALAD
jgi:hypothetical protein